MVTNQGLPGVEEAGDGQLARSPTNLRQAELETALDWVTATMHGLLSSKECLGLRLGPTLTAEVEIEGVPVQALVDTGSPATIVSLDLILEALAAGKLSNQTPDQWRTEVNQRLKPSTLSLQSYGRGQLDLICQIETNISWRGHHARSVIQIQKDAPVGLLLGTDLLSQLGFALLESNSEGEGTDLLQDQTWKKSCSYTTKAAPDVTEQDDALEEHEPDAPIEPNLAQEQVPLFQVEMTGYQELQEGVSAPDRGEDPLQQQGVVRLLQAVRLPARHKKLVRAEVEGLKDNSVALFEPVPEFLGQTGLSMPEAFVEPDESRFVTLVL